MRALSRSGKPVDPTDAEGEFCSQCGRSSARGQMGWEEAKFGGHFYCELCWEKWQVFSAGIQGLTRDASEVHGPGIEKGILHWAATTARFCWTCFKEDATVMSDLGALPRYCSKECMQRHRVAYAQVADRSGFTGLPPSITSGGPRLVEVLQICEAAAWVLWRERCYTTTIIDVDQESAITYIQVVQGQDKGLGFADPATNFASNAHLWYQLVGADLGRTAVGVVLSAMIAAIASPGVRLTLGGEEVSIFGASCGRYVGPCTLLLVQDVTRDEAYYTPCVRAGTQLPSHDWAFVRTTGGAEWIIDLTAVQFGDRARSQQGLPMRFSPKDVVSAEYAEDAREVDPLEAYYDILNDMLTEQTELQAATETSNLVDSFLMLQGKLIAFLGLSDLQQPLALTG